MKKITRLADSVLERLVKSSSASASKNIGWTECRWNAFCAVTGRRERMSCYLAKNKVVVCSSTGCGC